MHFSLKLNSKVKDYLICENNFWKLKKLSHVIV